MSTMTPAQFWKSMGERFGTRWFEVHGAKPTKTWSDLLRQFAEDIDSALLRLKDRPERERAHPPSHAEFQVLLVAAKKTRGALDDAADVRQHWRSIVYGTCMRHAALLNLVPWGVMKLDQLPQTIHRSTLGICQELVNWGCETEAREGRTPALEQHINSTLWNHLRPWEQKDTPTSPVPRGTQLNNEVST